MKICGKCKLGKSFSDFHKRSASIDGFAATCRSCHKQYKKNYYEKNKDRLSLQMKEYSEKNKPQIKRYLKVYYKDNRETFITKARIRQTKQSKATPNWLTEEHKQQIKDLYWLARDLEAVTGEKYHVDHIVPLQGKNVSGLHVPWNLQVLPSDVNLRKKNKHVA